jgi:hypothetical protein
MHLRPALAALVALLALPAAAGAAPAPARPAAASSATKVAPTLHLAVGTGACATAHSDITRVDNPCWLQLGVVPAVRIGPLEVGLAYEGRELLKLLTFTLVQPPAATTLGASAAWVHEPSERWRLSAGGEAGWRRYSDFAGSGIRRREGAIDVPYLGAVGRAALGLRPQGGRADRLEVSLALRSDLTNGHDTVDFERWTAGGWSITMSLGLLSEW